jgi:hypothetical protein
LLTKYYAAEKIEKNEMGRVCSTCGRELSPYMILVGKAEGKRRFGGHGSRWDDNIKTYLQEIVSGR